MTNITDLDQLNTWSDSRVIINDNFNNLNNDKVEVEAGKWLSENDFTNADKAKLDWIESWAEANTVDSVNSQTWAVVLDKTDIGLWNVDNTSDADKPVSTATQTALDWKEDSFTKNTAFNKDFWTTAWTVAEWDALAGKQDALGYNPLEDVIAGTNVTIDKTDPLNPIISASWGGGWSWDMTKVVYDPQTIEADAFLRSNHTWPEGHKVMTTLNDPAVDSINTAMIDANDWVIIVTTTAWNNQELEAPTDTTIGKAFIVINDNNSTDPILINGNPLQASELVIMVWEWTKWTTEPLALALKWILGTFLHTWMETVATIGGTTFDINPWVGYIVDNYTNADVPKVTRMDYAWSTGNTITNIATNLVTYLSLDINGSIIQSVDNTFGEPDRDRIRLWTITHQNFSTITAFDSVTHGVGWDVANAFWDLSRAIWLMILNDSDFAFSAASNDMTLARSAGTVMAFWINRTNRKNPNNLDVTAENPIPNFITSWRDGLGGFTLNSINSDVTAWVYDDNTTGWITEPNGNVNNSNFVNHRLYYSPDLNLVGLAYGQVEHNNLTNALQFLPTEAYDKNPLFDNVLFRGWLTLKGNATDLSDMSQAVFTTATKFGSTGGSWSTSTVTTQETYDNSSQPQVTTDATRWAMQYKRGSNADTDNVLEILNWAWAVTLNIDWNGNVTGNNLSWTNTWDQDLSWLALKTNVLELDNTTVFTPDADYEPATKKYVDDNAWGGGGTEPEYDAWNSGTSITIDWDNSINQKVTLTWNCTFTLSNPANWQVYVLKLIQDATGGRTVTLPSSVKTQYWSLNTSTGNWEIDILSLYYDWTDYFANLWKNYE